MGIDPAYKREAFRALKEAADNGRLVPTARKKIPEKVRKAVLARQEGLCAKCGVQLFGRFHIDHDLERHLMGADHESNYRALCAPCHIAKTSERAPVLAHVNRLHEATWEEPIPNPHPIQSRNEWPAGQKIAAHVNPWGRR